MTNSSKKSKFEFTVCSWCKYKEYRLTRKKKSANDKPCANCGFHISLSIGP